MDRSIGIWCLCLQQVFRTSGYIFFANWLPTFLQATRDVSVSASGVMQGFVFAGATIGSHVGGTISDQVLRKTGNLRWSRSGIGGGCTLGCGLLVFTAYLVDNPTAMISLVTCGAFLAGAAAPITYVVTIDLGKEHVSTIFGLMNIYGNIGAAITPILVGNFFAGSTQWNQVLLFFGTVYFAGAISWMLIDPRRAVVGEQ